MTYTEKLKLFNLNDGYTKEELEKAHKKLMRKYHPDLYMRASEEERTTIEEKCKEINEAYKELLKGCSSVKYTQTQNNTSTQYNNLKFIYFYIKYIHLQKCRNI